MKIDYIRLENAGFEEYSYHVRPEIAGFEEHSDNIYIRDHEDARIYYNAINGRVCVKSNCELNSFLYNSIAETEEELSKTLYAFLKYDLDFDTKIFNWTNCSKIAKIGFYIDSGCDIVEHEDPIYGDEDEANIFRTKNECFSSLASSKLSHVIHYIDRRFPKKTSKDQKYAGFYPVYNTATEKYVAGAAQNKYPFKVICESEEGCKILIRDNQALLNQLYNRY